MPKPWAGRQSQHVPRKKRMRDDSVSSCYQSSITLLTFTCLFIPNLTKRQNRIDSNDTGITQSRNQCYSIHPLADRQFASIIKAVSPQTFWTCLSADEPTRAMLTSTHPLVPCLSSQTSLGDAPPPLAQREEGQTSLHPLPVASNLYPSPDHLAQRRSTSRPLSI